MKALFKASLITGFAFLINVLSNAIRAKFAAVYLGPDGIAVLAQINSFIGLAATFTSLGLATAIVRYIAAYKAEGKQIELRRLILTAVAFTAIASVIVSLILLITLPLVTTAIFGKPMFLTLMAVALLNIPVSVVTTVAVAILQGFKEIKLDAAIGIFSSIVVMVLIVLLLIPFKLPGAIVGSLLGNIITSLVFTYFFIEVLDKHLNRTGRLRVAHIKEHFVFNSLKPLFGIAFASVVIGGITNLTDILVRSNLISTLGLTQAGILQPALSFSLQYTALLGGAIGTYALPRLSELTNQKELFIKELNDYLRLLILAITPAACALAALAPPLIVIMYSSEFLPASALIPIQSVADIIRFVFVAISGAIFALGKGKAMLVTGALTPIVYYLSFLGLIQFLGLQSVPVASVIAWGVSTIACYFVLRSLGFSRIFPRNLWLIFSSLIATAAVAALALSGTNQWAAYGISTSIVLVWAILNITRHEFSVLIGLISSRIRPS